MEAKKPISHIVAGLLIGVVIVIIQLLSTYGSDNTMSGGGLASILAVIVGLPVFIYLYGKARNHAETFGNLFSYGFKATAVLTLVVVVYMLITSYVMPEIKEKGLQLMREEMENNDRMTDSDIDNMMDLSTKYFWLFAIGGNVLYNIILGAISSLIGAAITPKRPKNPFEQPNL